MGLDLLAGVGEDYEHRAFSDPSGLTESYIRIKVNKVRDGAIKRICKLSG